MPNPFSSFRMTRLLYAGLAVILLATAYLAGVASVSGLGGFTDGDYQKGYSAGFDAAHQKLLNSTLGAGLKALRTTSLTGTISKIADGKITLTVPPMVLDPLAEPAPAERMVILATSTVITVQTFRAPAEFAQLIADYQKKFAAFQKKAKPGEMPPAAPLPYEKKTGALADLALGDKIQVFGAPDSDLTLLTEITNPTRIIKQSQPPTGAGP